MHTGFMLAAFLSVHSCMVAASDDAARISVLPRPVIENWKGVGVVLKPADSVLNVRPPDSSSGGVAEGLNLLRKRLEILGHGLETRRNRSPQILLKRCSRLVFEELLSRHGIAQTLEPARLEQAYHLVVEPAPDGRPSVTVRAAHDWGFFYAIVTLCQLLERDETGALAVPSVEVLDFPALARRLAKTSAGNPPDRVARFVSWMPLYKISQVGLHLLGENSRQPDTNFRANVTSLCPRLRAAGTLESIVYFCPFRGTKDEATGKLNGAYDLSVAADRAAYADYLLWIMAQGAHGIEVDYNDWGDTSGVPISDVLNLAHSTVKNRYPDAYVLYCPPAFGEETYRGMSTPQMGETLSRVPETVWPLWTGVRTIIVKPLEAKTVKRWTEVAGRRPFLWVNRVAPHVNESFSQAVPGIENSLVFQGDLLPRDLHALFEGVHLNAGFSKGYSTLPSEFDAQALVYMATAADFLWNPQKWEAAESYRRAVRFVSLMSPLLDKASAISAPASERS